MTHHYPVKALLTLVPIMILSRSLLLFLVDKMERAVLQQSNQTNTKHQTNC